MPTTRAICLRRIPPVPRTIVPACVARPSGLRSQSTGVCSVKCAQDEYADERIVMLDGLRADYCAHYCCHGHALSQELRVARSTQHRHK